MVETKQGIPVQVHLESSITQDNTSERFVFDSQGQLAQIGGNLYIRYVETTPEEGDVPVTVKIMQNKQVRITRSASSKLNLLLENQKQVASQYQTPYGNLNISTVTTKLDVKLMKNPLRGVVEADYMIYNGQELLGKYNIRLQFTV